MHAIISSEIPPPRRSESERLLVFGGAEDFAMTLCGWQVEVSGRVLVRQG